jgi:hypothetical protein
LRIHWETNAEDLTQPDSAGNLPSITPPVETQTARYQTHFPAFYTKYVVVNYSEVSEAAAVEDADGTFPDSGSQLGKTMD